MNKLYVFVGLIWMVLIIVSLNPLVVKFSTEHYMKKFSNEYPDISVSELEIGDLVFGRSKNPADFIPGYWTHTAVFMGFENGTAMVIQSESDLGVNKQPLSDFIDERKHIMVGKINASKEQKFAATYWMVSKENASFDGWYPGKQLNGEKYYCSELIWVGYMKQGIDIDPNPGFTWTWGNAVSPDELFENPAVEIFNLRT